MHDTALVIGKHFLDLYCTGRESLIVDIGALDVNGSLRGFAPSGVQYVGLDLAAGPGVDVVMTAGAGLPLADASADVVLATSVFEHDTAFWLTFREMCRVVKPGGYIYVSAPSNSNVHRYPLDCWRFYPDAGRALVLASQRDGTAVTLVESFVAERQADTWNDFVAVFQRDGGPPPGPGRLHALVPCRNAIDVDQGEVGAFQPETQDGSLIASLRAERDAALAPGTAVGDIAALRERGEACHAAVMHQVIAVREMLAGEVARLQAELAAAQAREAGLRARLAALAGE